MDQVILVQHVRSDIGQAVAESLFRIKRGIHPFRHLHYSMKPSILDRRGANISALFRHVSADLSTADKRNILNTILSKKAQHLDVQQPGFCFLNPATLYHLADWEYRKP